MLDYIYEFRYYNLLPFNQEINIYEVKELEKDLKEVRKLILHKAQELKIVILTSKEEDIDDAILKHIFTIRAISLEELNIKLIKEKDIYYLQVFDEDAFEEKMQIEGIENIDKKSLEIKFNKKIKVFT